MNINYICDFHKPYSGIKLHNFIIVSVSDVNELRILSRLCPDFNLEYREVFLSLPAGKKLGAIKCCCSRCKGRT